MLGSLTLFFSIMMRPADFPSAPLAAELARGESLAIAKKGKDRTLLDDRAVIGRWFDGKAKRDVEEAVWLSPSLVSRWFGWRRNREAWPQDEISNRWRLARDEFGGRLTFIVRLCTFPKQNVLEESEEPAVDGPDIESLRAVLVYGGNKPKYVAGNALFLGKMKAPTADKALKQDWSEAPQLRLVFGSAAFAAPSEPELDPNLDFQLGGYTSTLWLVQCPLPNQAELFPQFELKIETPNKERIARFTVANAKAKKRFFGLGGRELR